MDTKSLRAEVEATGAAIGRAHELGDCDEAARLVAFAVAQRWTTDALPEGLLEVMTTFEDLAHVANVRLSQEGKAEVWAP
jgi:hypothetical protein